MKKLTQTDIRQVQMNILDELVKICRENHLQCYLAFGSLLGAVRHKGYIPWDDDIDVCLTRDQYEKLLEILRHRELAKPEWMDLIDDTCEGYYYPFAKVVDNRTEVEMERHTTRHGIWVDIFPIDGMAPNKTLAAFHIFLCSIMRVVVLAMDANLKGKKKNFEWFYKCFFKGLAHLAGVKRVCALNAWMYKFWNVKKAKHVGTFFTNRGVKDYLDKERLLKVAEYEFENRKYEGYADYDYYLGSLYGEYMKIPPMEQQRTHAFNAWQKNFTEA
ncbi:MAG: LicD family protein [Fibrobacteraceae bacterium]|nr:LicD family protein [Fibrobacteraceae bacterium]